MSLVWVRINGVETTMGRTLAEASDSVEILEGEPALKRDGSPRRPTRAGGRPRKPKTSVAAEAAKKKAAPQPELAAPVDNDTTAEEIK